MSMLDRELRLVTPSDSETWMAKWIPAQRQQFGRQISTHARLPRAVTADVADAEAESDATRPDRVAARRHRLALGLRGPKSVNCPRSLSFYRYRLYTSPRNWNETQRKMMHAAARVHVLRGAGGASRSRRSLRLRPMIFAAVTVPRSCGRNSMAPLSKICRASFCESKTPVAGPCPHCARRCRRGGARRKRRSGKEPRRRARGASRRARVLSTDKNQATYLYDRLLRALPSEFDVIYSCLAEHCPEALDRLPAELDRSDGPARGQGPRGDRPLPPSEG